MLIAVLSDVHGNLRALEAVLKHIRSLKTDAIVNLGDCVSGPLWPREASELLQSAPMVTVRGNHDRVVGAGRTEPMSSSDRFAHERISNAQRNWLSGLPFEQDLEDVWCFHANPGNDTDYLVDEVSGGRLCLARQNRIRAGLGSAKSRLILCGHSHQPRVVRLGNGAVIINPGSVGCPAYVSSEPAWHASETGAPHARYALITTGANGLRIELAAVEYDWEEAAATAVSHGRPDWAHALRTGYALQDGATPR